MTAQLLRYGSRDNYFVGVPNAGYEMNENT